MGRVSASAGSASSQGFSLSKVRDLCAPSLAIFILLESVSVLTIASAKGPDNRPIYNSATVVLSAELFKLVISLVNVWDEDPWFRNYRSRFHWPSFLAYALPALLYAVNNNIYLKVLTMIHPSIFQLFMNLRVVWTGLVFRFTLQRTVTPRQWAAMLVLFIGCALTVLFPASPAPAPAASSTATDATAAAAAASASTVGGEGILSSAPSTWTVLLSLAVMFMGLLLTLAYTFISTAASVIGEVLLKGHDSLNLANAQLYFFGVLFNGVGIALQGAGSAGAVGGGYFRGWDHPVVWAIVVLMAVVGLVTSKIMKNFDSIVKIFCVSIGNFVVYAYSVAFQGQSLAMSFITAFLLVSAAAYSYQTEKLRLDAAAAAGMISARAAGTAASPDDSESVPASAAAAAAAAVGGASERAEAGEDEDSVPLKPMGPRLSAGLGAGAGRGRGIDGDGDESDISSSYVGRHSEADSVTDGVAALLDEDAAIADIA